MTASGVAMSSSSCRRALRSLRREAQREAMLWTLPVLYVPGFILFGSASRLPDPLQAVTPALALCIAVSGALLLREVSYDLAAMLLVAGCVLADVLIAGSMGIPSAVALLALPVGLATLFISTLGGALSAALCTALLLYGPAVLTAMPLDLRLISILGMWSTVGMVWLALRPLLASFQWSWSSTEQNIRLLEEARDQRLRLKQALADLADANLQLTRLNDLAQGLRRVAEDGRRAKEQFVANVSHELRTPLNMIIGFSEMILKTPEVYGRGLPPVLLADLAVIQRNSQHLANLIDDVLDLSQIEAGKMALSREPTVLAEVVESAVAAVRPLFQGKRLSLESEVAPGLPTVLCDPTRIREVVLNLLSNAGRFTERGGVQVRAWQDGAQVVVSVADTGPGIASGDIERIFLPFEQLDASLRRRHGGSGLGLSISKGFVELHGGKMWLESQIGVGTSFFFSLPIDPPAPAEAGVLRWLSPTWEYTARQPHRPASVQPPRPRFVVVESGDALSRLLRRYLNDAEVASCGDLDAALNELAKVPAQCLLVNAPSVGTALQQLNVPGRLPPGTPAIICAVPGGSRVTETQGASGYLVKPISREALLAALERLVPAGKAVKTVLIVDDDPEARQLFWRMLGSAGQGYRVLPAADGKQALDIARTERPDAILLDLVMPEVNGFQFLETRSQEEDLRQIPVVVISACDPAGQPIVASGLAVTLGGGLAVPQLLGCVQGISQFLATAARPGGPAQPGTLPG